jgi:hypothetical protein
MSLAMTAATINDNDNNDYNNFMNDSIINKKRQGHNKTQKRIQNNNDSKSMFDMKKVNSVLNSIHNRVEDDDDNSPNYESAQHSEGFKPLNPFNPPDKPVSMGSERTKKEGLSNLVPQPSDDQDLSLQELQSAYMNDSQVREYYSKLMPGYKNQNKGQQQQQQHSNYYQQSQPQSEPYLGNDTNQVLIDKLNYMINLLEEQQDQRTNNVTEEVVLYSFLGVFMIFIVDSFARVGKYVR